MSDPEAGARLMATDGAFDSLPTWGEGSTVWLTADEVAEVDPRLAEYMRQEPGAPIVVTPSVIEEQT